MYKEKCHVICLYLLYFARVFRCSQGDAGHFSSGWHWDLWSSHLAHSLAHEWPSSQRIVYLQVYFNGWQRFSLLKKNIRDRVFEFGRKPHDFFRNTRIPLETEFVASSPSLPVSLSTLQFNLYAFIPMKHTWMNDWLYSSHPRKPKRVKREAPAQRLPQIRPSRPMQLKWRNDYNSTIQSEYRADQDPLQNENCIHLKASK